MWDHLYSIHVTQCQGINVHHYYQELYTRKWDEQITMSEHIGFFFHLRCCINDSEQKLDDIHIVHAICNDLKLELRLHLGKDLRKYKGLDRSGKA